jgi:ADP-dependent NAD(P)H-hydrate dehydratase
MTEGDDAPQPGSSLPKLPARPIDGHKGTFGTVVVVGGCCAGATRMIGAPALAARAAFRSGAGLVKVAAPDKIIEHVLGLCPSATGVALPTSAHGEVIAHEAAPLLDELFESADAIVVGPGMGRSASVQALALRCVQQARVPVVVDADALNALAELPDLVRDMRAPCVFTPHVGEFRRLAAALKITDDPTHPSSRPAAAMALAQRLGCICVLKGAGTIVSNGLESWECQHVNPILATAGTGDVLAGLLGTLLAQRGLARRDGDGVSEPEVDLIALAAARLGKAIPEHLREKREVMAKSLSLFDLVRIGVEAHAYAGESHSQMVKRSGMLASELADHLAEVMDGFRESEVD